MPLKIISDSLFQNAKSELSNYLVKYRSANGLTQAEAARRMGISKAYYRDFEYGEKGTRLLKVMEFVKRFADLKGIAPEEFVAEIFSNQPTFESVKPYLTKTDEKLLEIFRTIDVDLKKKYVQAMSRHAGHNISLQVEAQAELAKVSKQEQIFAAMMLVRGLKK